MPAFTADFHSHTPTVAVDCSDCRGTSPRDIVERAAAVGLDILAITDHFSADAVGAVARAARDMAEEGGRRLLVIGGAELKIRSGADEVHLLALFEADRARGDFATLLGLMGLPDPPAPEEALSQLEVDGNPLEICRMVCRCGGFTIVAHVDTAFGEYRLLDSELLEGLMFDSCALAVEVCHSTEYAQLMHHAAPAMIGSSDSHSLDDIGSRKTIVAMPDLSYESLRIALQRRSSVPILS